MISNTNKNKNKRNRQPRTRKNLLSTYSMLLLGLSLSIVATTSITGYKAQASSEINAVVNPVNGSPYLS
jgi:hypothetical protein